MRMRSIMAATTLFVSGLAFAQTCSAPPGTVCLVPPRGVTTTTTTSTATLGATTGPTTTAPVGTTTTGITYVPAAVASGSMPMATMTCPMPVAGATMYSVPMASMSSMAGCQTASLTPETVCVLNELSGMRAEMRSARADMLAMQLETQGQQLVARASQLMADEMAFRQNLQANPNMAGAQATANQLTARAADLNRDIAAYNRRLASVPADLRPQVAQDLNGFQVAYWQPTIQRFQDYQIAFAGTNAYQPAYAANPWLQGWQAGYQASINNITQSQQQVASNPMMSTTMVAGSTEYYYAPSPYGTTPGLYGTTMVMPNGSVLYIPPSGAGMSTMGGAY